MSPKFSVGQLVQPSDGHKPSKVVHISSSEDGVWNYAVEAKSFDADTEEVVFGVRHYSEAELSEPVEEAAPAPADVAPEATPAPEAEVPAAPEVTPEAAPAEPTPEATSPEVTPDAAG